MKLISRHRNLPTLIEEYNAGRYNLNHPLQRPGGQWNLLQQSELIDSVFRDYSIDPVTVVSSMSVNGETKKIGNAVIDGIQRITTFARFFNNEFRLSKKLEDEPFIIDDVTYLPSEVLWGKKYDELEDKLKDKLKTFELSVDFYSDATEKEIRELFALIQIGSTVPASVTPVILASRPAYIPAGATGKLQNQVLCVLT